MFNRTGSPRHPSPYPPILPSMPWYDSPPPTPPIPLAKTVPLYEELPLQANTGISANLAHLLQQQQPQAHLGGLTGQNYDSLMRSLPPRQVTPPAGADCAMPGWCPSFHTPIILLILTVTSFGQQSYEPK